MIAERIPELKHLSLEDKLALVGELWEELSAHPEIFPPVQEHVQLLQERQAHYRRNPGSVSAWEDVKARILASR